MTTTALPANVLAEGMDTVRRAPPGVLVVFGASGDLTHRKLLPALYRRYAAGQVSGESRIFGVARTVLSRADYVTQAQSACREFLGRGRSRIGRWPSVPRSKAAGFQPINPALSP